MAFQISCLMFLAVLLLAESEGYEGSCDNATHFFDTDLKICCDKCRPGFHMKEKCSQLSATFCVACPEGLWSQGYSYNSNCRRCTKCPNDKGLEFGQICSKTEDAKCVCQPGKYCRFEFNECKECRTYKSCPKGQGVITAGTATSNVRCGPCPQGTFSDQLSSTQECKAHSKCRSEDIKQNGSSNSDTVCKTPVPSDPPSDSAPIQKPTTQSIFDFTSSAVTPTADFSTTTGTPRVVPLPSSGNQSPTHPMVAVFAATFAAVAAVVIVVYRHLKKKRGLSEKKAKVGNGYTIQALLPPEPSRPDHQLLLSHGDVTDPPVSSSERQTPSSRSSSRPNPGPAGLSSCYMNQGDFCGDHPQSPITQQVVNVNVNITACAVPVSPTSTSTPRPNERPAESDSELPLSQEEVHISCPDEQGKDHHTAVPETGEFVC
ncbi:tumor necrosis factor receptor superfamily member 1B isoform X2 [Clupea harengus]|uniref:Tumor necrosis factor receptor superfamily member 1B isoform X2 n=1 Tax=Clupea harengus TaxID=7950 RepID=A0A6P8FIY8_CLUHA|nr:tumor necrosis factor receptor superfamily member 1B isoform X2 [Clupea harengus]